MTKTIVGAIVFGASIAGASACALAQTAPATQTAPAVQNAPVTYGDWRIDAPGAQHKITLSDLPAPFATEPKAEQLRSR